jgi:4-methyl-5(b-hydroxyethyl)-thiazole monophosphate biosynthesis
MNKYKLAILVATGYEDTELITAIDLFSRAELDFDLISVENKTTVKGSYNAYVKTVKYENTNLKDYNGLFLPGGKAIEILDDANFTNKTVKHALEND